MTTFTSVLSLEDLNPNPLDLVLSTSIWELDNYGFSSEEITAFTGWVKRPLEDDMEICYALGGDHMLHIVRPGYVELSYQRRLHADLA